MDEWICYSLNDYVQFKLNESGRKRWLSELRVAHDAAPDAAKHNFPTKLPEPNEKGFYQLQLWEICNIFGSIMGNGLEPPIETRILIKPIEEIEDGDTD